MTIVFLIMAEIIFTLKEDLLWIIYTVFIHVFIQLLYGILWLNSITCSALKVFTGLLYRIFATEFYHIDYTLHSIIINSYLHGNFKDLNCVIFLHFWFY